MKSPTKEKLSALVKFMKQVFSQDRRLLSFPKIFYYSLRENHLELQIEQEGDHVVIRVRPGKKLNKLLQEFVDSTKQSKFKDFDKVDFNIQINARKKNDLKECIKAYCKDESKTDFSYHFLQSSKIDVQMDRNNEVCLSIDQILGLLMESYEKPYFSIAEVFDLSQDVQIYNQAQRNQGWGLEDPSSWLQQKISQMMVFLENHFKELNQEEMKNFMKCLKYMEQFDLQSKVQFKLVLKGFLNVEGEMDLQGISYFLEFFLFCSKQVSEKDSMDYKKKYHRLKFE